MSSKRIGVGPPGPGQGVARLLAVLSEALPVRFEAREAGEHRGLDALVTFGGDERQARAAARDGVPSLAMVTPERGAPGATRIVATSASTHLDRRLRGRTLADAHVDGIPAVEVSAEEVLASGSQGAVWTRSGLLSRAAASPLELDDGQSLRERLATGRCAALLPLLHLLREVTTELRWRPPRSRAALVLDDPNLHWPSYGFLDLRELARDARCRGYHVALATIPLDARFAHRDAIALLQAHPQALSLLVHGNDHTKGELGRPAAHRAAIALAAQAMRRVQAFERRARIPVSRVMAPPHELYSRTTVRALLRCGFQAISMTQPCPSEPNGVGASAAHAEHGGALTGWRPADIVAGGLPSLLRHPLTEADSTELAVRAFLDQPLILYGHHVDLADGLEVLHRATDAVNVVARPQWSSLADIAAGSFETRREDALLRVRLLARRAQVTIPAGVEALAVELPPDHGEPAGETVTVDGRRSCFGRPEALTAPLAADAERVVEVELVRRDSVDPWNVAAPPRRPLTLARRMAGEGRDRALPLLHRTRRARATRLG